MNIQRIDRLRNHKIFRDFSWPGDLPDFAQYNLIYGWNGSGKTTISRVLRDLELRHRPSLGEVALIIDGSGVRGEDFVDTSFPVRVFNRDFVTENVFPTGGGDVPPILILGEENIEKQKQLDEFRAALAKVRTTIPIAQNEKTKSEQAADRHCVSSGALIKDLLRGSAGNPYNNYNKRDYIKCSEDMLVDGDHGIHRLQDADRSELITQHSAPARLPVEEPAYDEPGFVSLRTKTADLLSVSVIAETIQSLSDDTELSNWVRQGLELHGKRDTATCLFCLQSLPAQRMPDLEGHFNAAYQDHLNSLANLTDELDVAAESLTTFIPPNSALFYERFVDEYESTLDRLGDYRTQVNEYLSGLTDAVSKKQAQPFVPVSLPINDVLLPDTSILGELSRVIDKNNQECANHTAVAEKARKKLEDGTVAERLDEFKTLRDIVASHGTTIQRQASQERQLVAEIASLEAKITEHRAPAEELNEDLHKYMGHKELQMDIKDNGYAVSRSGVPASQLSEGETTAIALLYFLKSLTDRRFDFSNGVVVLDDPMSSLDSNSLFSAFGLIQDRTKEAGQLFILTHNFTFFRQVRNWFRYVKDQNKTFSKRPCRFYMLNCLSDDKGRYSRIEPLDPLLERFESDYHFLFASVVRGASASTGTLETHYSLPNMARRLLEAFLAFRQPNVSGELWQKMQYVNFDAAKKTKILRFVHSYSHNDAIGEPEHDLSLLGEASNVLSDLLGLVESEDPGHYQAMVNLVQQGDDDEDG